VLRRRCKPRYERFWRYGGIVATVLGSLIMAILPSIPAKRISDPSSLTRAAQAVALRADYSVRAPADGG
jgi:hypothetical protein